MPNEGFFDFYDEDKDQIRWGRILFVVIGLIFVIATIFSTFVIVPAGHRAVVLMLGAVEGRVFGEGFHVIAPFFESVQIMEVRTVKYEATATAATKDLLDVTTQVAVNYHIAPSAVNDIFQTVGLDYENRLIAPAVQEVVKSVTARFDAEQLITQRPVAKQAVDELLAQRLSERSIIVETVSLTDFKYPDKFNQAIIDKQTAIQLKQKAENDLGRIQVEAQQAVAKAEGDARAIQLLQEQLKVSPDFVRYMAVQKWNGILPIVTGGGNMPLIDIPLASFTTAQTPTNTT